MGTKSIEQRILNLRERRRQFPDAPRRATQALARLFTLWQSRLNNNWTPPPGSPFPWAMVRRSLEVLVDGDSRFPAEGLYPHHTPTSNSPVLALILAGNTPLLAWPALIATLAAGIPIFVKLSRGENLWTRLLVESLGEVDSEIAALVELDIWPGADARTRELIEETDAVVAYGSDATIRALRGLATIGKPFYGFGHAVSVGLALPGREMLHSGEGFARDTLMYGQQGCLSPQAIFVEGDAEAAGDYAAYLAAEMKSAVDALEVAPVTDPAIALAVRTARDMAAFTTGTKVFGDTELRWTIIARRDPVPLDLLTGHGVLTIIPVGNLMEDFGTSLGSLRGKVSAVGYQGRMKPEIETMLRCEGITYLCPAGQMQTPPLNWPNGKVDLFQEMRLLARRIV